MSAQAPVPPEGLVDALDRGDCALFVGAGLPARAGLPTWGAFARQLFAWSRFPDLLSDEELMSFGEALDKSDYGAVIDEIVAKAKSKRATGVLQEFLRQTFLGVVPPPVFQSLARLPFWAALTTNLDDFLEQAYPDAPLLTPEKAEELTARLPRRDFFLLKLYGTLAEPDTVQISPAEYERRMAASPLFARFMESLFHSKTLLFLGASLDGISDYLAGHRFTGNPGREHYALVEVQGSSWKVKAENLRRRYGIQVLGYRASEGHPEVQAFVDRLADDLGGPWGRAGPEAPLEIETAAAPAGPPLQAVELRDIGPFSRVRIDLSKHWNVLLGDNGVGKSSILRAIALALAGEDARSEADKLIRSGQPSGSVILYTGAGRSYVTDLYRTDAGGEVRAHSHSPLQSEGWLAVGFPALRALTWQRPTYTPGAPRPTSADLMPLLRGEADPRMDGVKAWLIDLFVDDEVAPDEKAAEKIDRLFSFVRALTPGLRLEPSRIDVGRKAIYVRTDDGEVPLESVSQGTSALLGWIGVLLQRLTEIAGTGADPLEQRALVLIDELDAHMHPRWQQALPGAVRRLFPRVQLVASTHSPLLVPSLERHEILSLRRDPQRGVVISRPEDRYENLRADQILTSELFRLETTFSPDLEKKLRQYEALAAKESPSAAETAELRALAAELGQVLPSNAQRKEAREAYELIRRGLEEAAAQKTPEERERLVREAKLQLQEAITGSVRPT
jgi:hypothetical protein